MSTAYILLGSNQNHPLLQLELALNGIDDFISPITKASSIYKTAAWGNTQQPAFYNQVIEVACHQKPMELLEQLLLLESQMGRVRQTKWEPRIIDLDILFFDKIISNQPRLSLPHPHLQERMFTLVPLNEIAPQLIHPKLGLSINDLLHLCTDPLKVEKI
jgi:2-amino-4-hydroxy-6-hydroxymethyldihydropteridine diphosphokinase